MPPRCPRCQAESPAGALCPVCGAVLPSFEPQRLKGSSLDSLSTDPAHQRRVLETLSGSDVQERTLGACTFRTVSNPVISDKGERIGTVMEWTDRTQEVGVEKEMQGMLSAVLAGDLSQRIALRVVSSDLLRVEQRDERLPRLPADQLASQKLVHAQVRGDAVEPRPHLQFTVDLRQPGVRPQERFLRQVVRFLGIAHEPIYAVVDALVIALENLVKGEIFASLDPLGDHQLPSGHPAPPWARVLRTNEGTRGCGPAGIGFTPEGGGRLILRHPSRPAVRYSSYGRVSNGHRGRHTSGPSTGQKGAYQERTAS